jgi:hypothetical protein
MSCSNSDLEFRISDFGFRISDFPSQTHRNVRRLVHRRCLASRIAANRRAALAEGLVVQATRRREIARNSPDTVDLAVLATRSKPAPSTNHNQTHVNNRNTPTSRKASPGEARRGFPRAGGRGVGAGRKRSRASPRPNAARRRAKGARGRSPVRPTSACARRTGRRATVAAGPARGRRASGTETETAQATRSSSPARTSLK